MPYEDELKRMTKPDLAKLSDEMGLAVRSKDTKAAMIQKILDTPGLDLHMAMPPRAGSEESGLTALMNRINKIEQTLSELVDQQKELIELIKRGSRSGTPTSMVDNQLSAGMGSQLKGQLQDPLKRWQSSR